MINITPMFANIWLTNYFFIENLKILVYKVRLSISLLVLDYVETFIVIDCNQNGMGPRISILRKKLPQALNVT